ncbi:MAG: gamma-glutamyl kinase [Pseudomonadota bacterium]
MLVFWKQRLVLLAVPKTGTTALEAALAPMADAAILNPPGMKHCNVQKYRRELAPFFEQKGRRPLSLVAVMREPVDWLGSWWRYRGRAALDGQPNSTKGVSFDAFVSAYLDPQQPDFARVGAQAKFLQSGVDHLFRYDHQDALLAFLEDRLGQLPPLERQNVSPVAEVDLSAQTRASLQADFKVDFDLWDHLCRSEPGTAIKP